MSVVLDSVLSVLDSVLSVVLECVLPIILDSVLSVLDSVLSVVLECVLPVVLECYLEMQFDNSSFRVSTAIHPSTYLNKILFASQQGALQLWNVHTNKLLFTFSGWGVSITALEQVKPCSRYSLVIIIIMLFLLCSYKNLVENTKYYELHNISAMPFSAKLWTKGQH